MSLLLTFAEYIYRLTFLDFQSFFSIYFSKWSLSFSVGKTESSQLDFGLILI